MRNDKEKAVSEASMLLRGVCMTVSEEFQRCYIAEDYQEVLDFINKYLPPAIKRYKDADEANPTSRRAMRRRKQEVTLPVQ